jgi:hypothetical protein
MPEPELSARAAQLKPTYDEPPLTALEAVKTVARRLDRSVRTVDRYIMAGILPQPMRIRGKRFFYRGVMPRFDKR